MENLVFKCECGEVQGTLEGITPSSGTLIQCHCDDCRRAVVWLGQPDPGQDGVTYYQTTPARVSFTAGHDKLAATTWKSPRLLRWHASCCKTPLFNTLDTPKWAFASVLTSCVEIPSKLGDVKAHAFVTKPNGKTGHTGGLRFMVGFARRTIAARLSGAWRTTPFFNEDGSPVSSPRSLTKQDRDTAQI